VKFINLADLMQRSNGSGDLLRLLSEELNSQDCGERDCPLHGHLKNGNLLDADASLSAGEALELAEGAIVSASNQITAGSDQRAKVLQVQARLWLDLHDRLVAEELEIAETEPSSGNEEQTVS
jgi:hypothetical protein